MLFQLGLQYLFDPYRQILRWNLLIGIARPGSLGDLPLQVTSCPQEE